MNGLSTVEAKKILAEHGPNVFPKKSVNALNVLGRQFKSSLIYLLIVAAVISFIINDRSDGFVIIGILFINTFLGFFQEYKSEKIIEKLSHFISHSAQVIRDGKPVSISAEEIVPGDMVVVREGDIVPADMHVNLSEGLEVNESQLTGESAAVMKMAAKLPEKSSIKSSAAIPESSIFTGSLVEKGYGHGIVFATGKDTQLGSIATLSEETKKETEYEKSLRSFSTFLVRVVLVCLGILVILKLFIIGAAGAGGTIIGGVITAADLSVLVLFVIALAVAIVPEALPVIATVTLSQGALKLAKKHVVVKRLSSLEDLGNTTLLCTDKTGTITENRMSIKKVFVASGEKNKPDAEDLLLRLFYASNVAPGKRHRKDRENPFAQALTDYVPEKIKVQAAHFKVETELPFDPESRRAYIVVSDIAVSDAGLTDVKGQKRYLIAIGAPEFLSKEYQHDREKDTEKSKENETLGLRYIGLSFKEIPILAGKDQADLTHFDILKNEHDMTFLGYVAFEDPLRPTARPTIELAEKLGVAIKIISGDSREVVAYVGREVGLVTVDEKVLTGDELDAILAKGSTGVAEYEKAVTEHNAFARVSPRQKYTIIETLKKTNIVAYQGDGINDAPALKLADVAIAVDSATDIAKENSDIILLSRNLETVINGIKSGRGIFVNIDKYIKYTMVGNFGNFLALSALYLTSSTLPILPIQILLTNLLTDLPLISIASDTVSPNEVIRPTKHNPRELIFISLILGIPTALFELAYFAIITAYHISAVWSETGLFVFLSFQLAIFFSVRTRGFFWKASQPSKLISLSFIAGFIICVGIIYIPWFERVFSFVPLSAGILALIVAMTGGYFLVLDTIKVLYYRMAEKTKI
jgi:Mg2+-importing ATPase